MSNIPKYLREYAEKDIQRLEISLESSFVAVLVIPVYNESWEAIQAFLNYSSNKSYALILVFNAPDIEMPSQQELEALANTQSCLLRVRENLHLTKAPNYEYGSLGAGNSVFIIDRTVNRIPVKQGVGLARKLGLDLALKLCKFQEDTGGKRVEWIHSTDADVHLPEGYFDTVDQIRARSSSSPFNDLAALVYPFVHQPEPGYELAMSLYELSLRYYVEGLAKAGSPYAFHTIGSLIAVNAESYATVRGIPKRAAGEDFYLLNKLAKIGQVLSLNEPTISIAGRPSSRVPFGTGPALNKIKQFENPSQEYTFYNSRCFEILKALLDIISDAERSFASATLLFDAIRARIPVEDSDKVIAALIELKIEKQFNHLAQKQKIEEFKTAFHTWFDAFITLRFIHILRDSGYENLRLEDLELEGFELDKPRLV